MNHAWDQLEPHHKDRPSSDTREHDPSLPTNADMSGGESPREKSSLDEGHIDLEGQPFLQGDEAEDKAYALRPLHDKIPADRSRWTLKLGLSLLFVVTLTVFALVAVALSFHPGTGSIDGGQDNVEHHDEPEDQHEDQSHQFPSVIQYQEDMPLQPQLRDHSEYELDMSWDFGAAPVTREYFWTIANTDLNPDGVYRPMLLINNQYPGPLVECNEGDTIIVHVTNRGVNATAVHFHGMFQNGTNSMDGTVGVTMCPIAPESTFTYKFHVRGQSGTYWYHAHHSAQASDGVLGPMVVHSKDERTLQELDYATDRVVMVHDHYHNTTAELLMDYLAPRRENEEPVPDNALINGRGSRNCADFPGWPCDSSNTSTYVFDLAAGQRHQLRFINVGAFAEFQIQFDEHPFYITEADGTDVHPEPFHRLNISPAQRYSVVLETNVTTADSFWMRARMVTHCFKRRNDFLEPEIRAIVRYTTPGSASPPSEPTSKDWSDAIEVVCRDLNTSALHPVVHVAAPPADDYVSLRANFMIGNWRLARGFFNESTWHANTTYPALHRFLDAPPQAATLDAPYGINNVAFDTESDFVLQTKGFRTVDLAITNFDDGSHPFHLHGHKFFVLGTSELGYPPPAEEVQAYFEARGGLENPLRRDVVAVEGYGWIIIRVVLDNPGLWSLHCHNTWHMESGMVMQLLVNGDVVRERGVSPQEREMCALAGVDTGMRPSDSLWFGSFDR